jgi:hypothetical protein
MNANRIISIIFAPAMALILYASSVVAEDTNVLPSLTIAGETFTNVEIGTVTGSRVTIYYDGGGKRVAISNLPPFLQKRLNYDPELARKQDAAEAERKAERAEKEAEAIAHAMQTLGPAQKIHLVKVLPDAQVQIEADGAISEAYIQNLPPEILVLVRDYQNAEAEVTNLEAQLAQVPGSSGKSGNHGHLSRQAARNQASTSAANASYHSNLETSLSTAKTRLAALKSQFSARSIITARPLAYFPYPHVRQWEYQSAAVAGAASK